MSHMFKNEPIWTVRSALAFTEWARRHKENPNDFGPMYDKDGNVITDYGYRCAKYFEEILKDMDKEGKLPTAKKQTKSDSEWKPLQKNINL